MTVPSTTRRAGPFTGTGALVAYPFTFKVFVKQDLAVTIADSNGLETDLVLDSTFTVTLNVDQEATPGGAVNYAVGGVATALPSGYTLVVTGDGLEFEQTADLPQGGNFSPVVIENALDRIVMLLQRLWDGVRRSMRLPDTASDSVSTVLPVPTANNFIGWDSNATALRNVDPNTLATVVAFAAWQSQAFSGDGVTTQFTLSSDPGNVNNLDVVVGAAPQRNNVDFTLSGVMLTFDVAPAAGLSIFCRWGQALPEGTSTLQTRLADPTSASNGPGLIAFNGALAYNGGSDDWVGGLLYTNFGRTADEITAGVTPTNYAYRPGHFHRYGAVGNGDGDGGGTNDYAAIAAALSVIVASGKPGEFFAKPGAIYRCDTGIVIDASVHIGHGYGAMIDFKNQAAGGYAITLGDPSVLVATTNIVKAPNYCQGFVFKGKQGAGFSSPPTDTRHGIGVGGSVTAVITGYTFKDCTLRNFTNSFALKEDANAQTIRLERCNLLYSTVGYYLPLPTSGAAGSGFVLDECFNTGCVTGMELLNPSADVTVSGGHIEGHSANYVYQLAGRLRLKGVHFETSGNETDTYIIRQQYSASYASVIATLDVDNCFFIIKSAGGGRTVPSFDFSKLCSVTFSGGEINTEASSYTGVSIFGSTGATALGAVSIFGTRLAKLSGTTIDSLYSAGLDINFQFGDLRTLSSADYKYLMSDKQLGPITLTRNSFVSGTPTYTMTFTRYMNIVNFTVSGTAAASQTTAGTSFLSGLPIPPAKDASVTVSANNGTTVGIALIDTGAGGRIYLPAWNDSEARVITGHYEI